MKHLRDIIIATLLERGEGLLDDEGVDKSVASQIADEICDRAVWVPIEDFRELEARLKNLAAEYQKLKGGSA